MKHTREEIIQRTIREFERLDSLIAHLTDEQWALPLPRPPSKDPWTVKDALAHITHWKADVLRRIRKLPQPPKERGLGETDGNRLVYLHWHDRPPQEVLAWHRQVQQEVVEALGNAPEGWFSGKERRAEWPYDLDGHSADHRVKDIEAALTAG
jgi:hypothetical protein